MDNPENQLLVVDTEQDSLSTIPDALQSAPRLTDLPAHVEIFPYLNRARMLVLNHFKEHIFPDLVGPTAATIIAVLLGWLFFKFPLGLIAVSGVGIFVLAYIILAVILFFYYYHVAPRIVAREQRQIIINQDADIASYIKRIQRLEPLEAQNISLATEVADEKDVVKYYEEWLKPALKMIVDNNRPCAELLHYAPYPHSDRAKSYHHIVRVGVVNTSADIIYGVTVALENLNGDPYHEYIGIPFPGRIHKKLSVNLSAEKSEYFDIAIYPQSGNPLYQTRTIQLCFTPVGAVIPCINPAKVHTLTLAAFGGSKPERKQFELFVNDKDILELKEISS